MKCLGERRKDILYQTRNVSCVFVSRSDGKILCVREETLRLPNLDELEKGGITMDELVLFLEIGAYEQDIFYEITAYFVQKDSDWIIDFGERFEWVDPQVCCEQFSSFQRYLGCAYVALRRYESKELVEQIHADLKRLVKPSRYQHSVAVSQMAERLAERYHVCVSKARLTGLAHDIAKYFTVDELIQYAVDHQLTLTEADYLSPKILHGPIGAHYVKEHYGFADDMCKAIYYHTTGHAKMTQLEKIIFLADKIDETRTYPGVDEFRELAFVDLNQAILKFLDDRIIRVIQMQEFLHPLSLETRNDVFLLEQEDASCQQK